MTSFDVGKRAATCATTLLLTSAPALAQTGPQPAGFISRVFDFNHPFDWYALVWFLLAMASGFVFYVIWFRSALAADLKAERDPNATRIASFGLAFAVFGCVFVITAHFGVGWCLVFCILGAALAAFGRAVPLAIVIIIAALLVVISRIYGWL